MKRYPSYKDSGVEWIGEIPIHWDTIRLKYIGEAIIGLTFAPNEVSEKDEQGILVLRASNIQNDKLLLEDTLFVNKVISDKLFLREGDILICSRSGSRDLIGKNICIRKSMEGATFGAFMVVFRSEYWTFLSHVFQSGLLKSQADLFLTTTINQLTNNTLRSFLIAIPFSDDEQSQIATFLDHKTTQIDNLIAKKQKLIELLKDERTALINQAVTKGLDPTVPMKDSGIEWLEEIPAHWQLKKLKYSITIKSGEGITNIKVGKEYSIPIYGGNGIMGYTDSINSSATELIVGRVGALCGNVYLVDGDKWISDNALRLTTIDNFEFLYYLLMTMNLNDLAAKTAQPLITGSLVKNQYYAVPPLFEQNLIVDFINSKNSQVADTIRIAKGQIQLLSEYKTSLINETVTGKIDVRDHKYHSKPIT